MTIKLNVYQRVTENCSEDCYLLFQPASFAILTFQSALVTFNANYLETSHEIFEIFEIPQVSNPQSAQSLLCFSDTLKNVWMVRAV